MFEDNKLKRIRCSELSQTQTRGKTNAPNPEGSHSIGVETLKKIDQE